MSSPVLQARYLAASPATAGGWQLERLTAPSRLFGANGLRTGPDGRVYVAQVTGSQISALDVDTGVLETVSAKGGGIIAPDDVAFDPSGNLYATEVMDGRVSVREAGGNTRVLRDDLPCANGITVHEGRLFINECRDGGRLMELDGTGSITRVLAENLPSTQVATGQVLRIDPRDGSQSVLAQLTPGLDNLTFVGDRLLVSNFTGEITEILPGGQTSTVLPGGLNWPLDLAVADDGNLYVADGTYFYVVRPDGSLETVGMLFSPGYPGFLRGVAATGAGEFVVTTSGGQVARYRPGSGETDYLATDFDQLYGVAAGPGDAVVFAELGTGRVHCLRSGSVETLASGLQDPVGVAFAPDGAPLVAESGAGRVVRLSGSSAQTMVDGLECPQGIVVVGSVLYIVDAGAKAVVAFDFDSKERRTIASGLPIGPAPGVTPKPLKGMPPFSGPQGPFAGIDAGPDGTLYVSADGDGSVLALRPVGT
jgi:sugar lactone lactonase YvrE